MRRNGETNPVTWILVLALAAAGFYVFHVAPVYLDNMEAKEACAEAFNTYWTEGEERALNRLLMRLNGEKSGTSHLVTDENGVEAKVPGLGLTAENVTMIKDQAGTLTIRVEYDRVIRFDPLKKHKKFHVVADKVGKQLK